MRFISFCAVVLLVGLTGLVRSAENPPFGLRVPPGFEVTEFADSKLANDIFSMTLDPRGRVVVSGRGYIRILVDDDNDGRADRALPFADAPKEGVQGLLWEGPHVYFTGDAGLRRFRVAVDGDHADGPSELIRALKTGGEHEAHAIVRGPDGWLYVLCGNMTGIDRRFAALPTSPIHDPVAGCVLRFSPDLRSAEIVADGFRNAYRMDFNCDGELFTFDSDNERCVSLPWYEPTRFYHVIPGGHYGWQAPQHAQFWRQPPYFCDVVAPVATLGRGSPTGVVCYRHAQFPQRYRGGMFLLDWTFGKVYFLSLQRSGSTYACRKEVFLESVGDNGFAPTDAVVHPKTGDLYISIGGRGTRGAVYRIRYPTGFKAAPAGEIQALQPKKRSLGDWLEPKALLTCAAAADPLQRLQALKAISRHPDHLQPGQVLHAIRTNWEFPDRYVRQAAADLIATLGPKERDALGKQAMTPQQQATYCLGVSRQAPTEAMTKLGRLLQDTEPETQLTGVRLLQLALGDLTAPSAKGLVWEGYSARRGDFNRDKLEPLLMLLRERFPSGQPEWDREAARLFAMVEDQDQRLPAKLMACMNPASDPVEDTHYLIVLARLRGPRSADLSKQVAAALLALDRKLSERHANRDRHWPLRIAEMQAELARKDPQFNAAILSHPEFGRPDHALFTRCPGFDRRHAAEVFLARAEKDEDYPWNADLVELIGTLPAERALPALRKIWDTAGLEESILPILAQQPQAADRDKFLHGMSSPQFATVRLCLEALHKLGGKADGPELLALVRALRGLSDGREEKQLREQIAHSLQERTGQQKLGVDKQAWTAWFTKAYPRLAEKLGGADGVDVAGWNRRLAKLDWSAGDVERGRLVFTRVNCASCHSGAQASGPDLHGVAGRFSRDDVFTAILQPSKDISPRYRTTLIATADGKIYQGLIVYEAVDGVILQTGAAATARLAGSQIASRRFTTTSLMPAGLLDKSTDREIADLYAYLKSLGNNPKGK